MTRQEDAAWTVLKQGVDELSLALSESQLEALLAYLDLLERWGSVYNLTSIRDRSDMVVTHLLDCLAVVNPLRRELASRGLDTEASLLDVGSGAGLPGVVLAVTHPHLRVTCIDTVAKKAAFVQQVALSLHLPNLKAVHGRVERHQGSYDVVCSRAFASIGDFTSLTKDCLAVNGIWLAMKGKRPDDELSGVLGVDVFHVEPLVVPQLDAERCIVWMRRQHPG